MERHESWAGIGEVAYQFSLEAAGGFKHNKVDAGPSTRLDDGGHPRHGSGIINGKSCN